MSELKENTVYPFHVFRFQIDFKERFINTTDEGGKVVLCSGAFAECSGLEATTEAKVIKEGGRNWGVNQRAGKTSFATLILKRGMTNNRDLWSWYEFVGTGKYSHRLNAIVTMFDTSGKVILGWKLTNCMPVKFKAADLNAKGTDVGIEELHLVHEGLSMASKDELVKQLTNM